MSDHKSQHDLKTRFQVPQNNRRVKVLRTNDSWFGVSYREDRPRVAASVRQLVTRGDYPERLWT